MSDAIEYLFWPLLKVPCPNIELDKNSNKLALFLCVRKLFSFVYVKTILWLIYMYTIETSEISTKQFLYDYKFIDLLVYKITVWFHFA